MAARTNSQFLYASLFEFISVWTQGGEASLNLTTSAGFTNVQLNCTLGHPGAPHSFPPSSSPFPAPPPHRPRHRGPSEKEKNRLRAARHQAARETAPGSSTPSSSSAVTGSVAASSAPSSISDTSDDTAPVTLDAKSFHCDKCDYTSNTEHGVKVHKGHQHKDTQKPEELRCETLNNSLSVSFFSAEREANTSFISTDQQKCEPFKCEMCEKEANSERKLKVHKAKWHTKVAPLYGNITRRLGFREKFSEECLICGKQFDDSEKHIRDEHDFIDEEAIKRGIFNDLD